MSAFEEILQAIIDGEDPSTVLPPGSRGEVLLQALLSKIKTESDVVSGHTTQLAEIARQNSNRYVRALAHKLASATEPICLLVQGDSTGNNETEWVFGLALWLEANFPQYSTIYRLWDDTNQNYLYPVFFTAGSLGDGYAALPGASGSAISTPNSAAFAITGDIDICAKVAMSDWSLAGSKCLVDKLGAAGSRAWALYLYNGTNTPYFWWSPDGTTLVQTFATAGLSGLVNGQPTWVKVTLDVNNGSGGYDIKFYQSSDGRSWTQLGDTITGTATTTLNSNTVAMTLGARGGTTETWAGKIYKAIVRNGIGGKIVASPDFGLAGPVGTTTFKDAEGNVWTVSGTCTVGNGSPSILILNASHPGASLSYSTDVTRFALQTPIEPALSFINYGHNEGASRSVQTSYEGLCTQLLTKYPNTGVVCMTQNPKKSPATYIIEHAIRCRQIAALSAKNDYALIDVYRAFVDTDGYADMINADGVHCLTDGCALWLLQVTNFVESCKV